MLAAKRQMRQIAKEPRRPKDPDEPSVWRSLFGKKKKGGKKGAVVAHKDVGSPVTLQLRRSSQEPPMMSGALPSADPASSRPFKSAGLVPSQSVVAKKHVPTPLPPSMLQLLDPHTAPRPPLSRSCSIDADSTIRADHPYRGSSQDRRPSVRLYSYNQSARLERSGLSPRLRYTIGATLRYTPSLLAEMLTDLQIRASSNWGQDLVVIGIGTSDLSVYLLREQIRLFAYDSRETEQFHALLAAKASSDHIRGQPCVKLPGEVSRGKNKYKLAPVEVKFSGKRELQWKRCHTLYLAVNPFRKTRTDGW